MRAVAGDNPPKLYTPALLSLSAELANFPLNGTFHYQEEARSRTCGSIVTLGFDLDTNRQVERIGMQVTACAVGQSSAAIMALAIKGRSDQDVIAVCGGITAWLAGRGALPDWPGFEALEPVLPHTGRHGALLLPWTAFTCALSSGASSG